MQCLHVVLLAQLRMTRLKRLLGFFFYLPLRFSVSKMLFHVIVISHKNRDQHLRRDAILLQTTFIKYPLPPTKQWLWSILKLNKHIKPSSVSRFGISLLFSPFPPSPTVCDVWNSLIMFDKGYKSRAVGSHTLLLHLWIRFFVVNVRSLGRPLTVAGLWC